MNVIELCFLNKYNNDDEIKSENLYDVSNVNFAVLQ